jgi:hypothetical protein
MSLNWNLTRIRNRDVVCWERDEHGYNNISGVTHTIIFATMAVDLGEISAKNVDEWLMRLQCLGRVYSDEGWSSITRQQLTDHIGLSTNVSNKTRKQFLSKMSQALERECVSEVKRSAELAGM